MIDVRDLELLLETYTFEDIMLQNEMTVADALHFLVEEEFIVLPEVLPV